MTVLLTGATGFLGSSLLKKFLNENYTVIALKRKESDCYRVTNELDRATFYNADEVDLADIFKHHTIDIVVNTVTDYGRFNKEISSIISTNLLFGLKLLELSIENNVKLFLNTDTLLERDINAYSLSKAQLVDWMKFLSSHTTKMVNLKIEHMYGPQDDTTKFVSWIIEQLKADVKTIPLTSGIQKRDFIYIDDIVEAFMTIILNFHTFPSYEEFELGSGHSIEVKEFLSIIYAQLSISRPLNTKLDFGAIPYRPNEKMDMQADISKLTTLGWKPNISLEDGIKNTLQGILK
ncbi:MAG: NAD-dependent epimerase/dehydratase [Sulfuricurvum sp.]|uniref:NAD-dependent epimerase/dehydratase family protein n=1 Tax=Sulfuricurvum sp. TaxID=2025608 RepID=UPI00272110D4|nr:NAD-dependent epimerase/dehydratase [Sulfuricurvum sp.]MDO9055518.1 NAD-dependent epimerase/dehydratase [Sulfuricurvum sp.]